MSEIEIPCPQSGGGSSGTESVIYQTDKAGGSSNGQSSGAWNRGTTVARTGVGVWDVVFDTAHPDGIEYHASLSIEEDGSDRDVPKISIIEGTKTASGFTVQITVDDNGTGADILTDQAWSFGVDSPVTVLTP